MGRVKENCGNIHHLHIVNLIFYFIHFSLINSSTSSSSVLINSSNEMAD